MRRVWLLAVHDVRLTTRDRAAFFWMLCLPVALMWLFGQMGGGGGTSKVRLTVVDRDHGWLARAFVAQLASPNVVVNELTPDAAARATDKIRTLVLPEGFTAKALAGEKQTLAIARDAGSASDFDLAADADVLRAVTRTLALLAEMGQTKAPAGAPEAEFARLAARPPLVRLDVTSAGTGKPMPSGTAQSVPGILTMTVLMMTVIYGGVFLTLEKRDGTLRRQAAGPVGRGGIVAGKLLGRLMVAAIQAAVLIVVGRLVFRVDFGSSPAGLLILLAAYAFCAAALATLCGAVFKTPEQASAVGWLSSMVMAALGGCWWPSEVVPRWLWSASHVFPTAWAMDAFHALISFGRGAEAVLLPALVLLAFGVIFAAIGARRLRLEGV